MNPNNFFTQLLFLFGWKPKRPVQEGNDTTLTCPEGTETSSMEANYLFLHPFTVDEKRELTTKRMDFSEITAKGCMDEPFNQLGLEDD